MAKSNEYLVTIRLESNMNPALYNWQQLIDSSKTPSDVVLKVRVREVK